MKSKAGVGTSVPGYVYVLTNAAMPGIVKIGRTGRDPLKRLREINSATGVPVPFRIAGAVRARDAAAAEADIHQRLQASRVNRKREFFRCSVERALEEAKAAASASGRRFMPASRFGPRAMRETSPRPPMLSALLIGAAGAFWIALGQPAVAMGWVLACLFCLATGRPRALSDALSLPAFIGPAGLALAAAAASAPLLLGYRYPELAGFLAWLFLR